MAWTGEVYRRLCWVNQYGDLYSIVGLECGHEQITQWPADELIKLREVVCVQCSKPHMDRIIKIQDSISFDDVLAKLRSTAVD